MGSYALPLEVYVAGLVFARVGAIVMLLPGIGEAAVPPRIRLAFALVLALVLFPLAAPQIAAIPGTSGELAGAVIKELLIGLMIGSLVRIFLSSLTVAGESVSLATTLSFAQTANPLGGQTNASLGTFLSLMGITLLFTTDLHHLFIGAIARSYILFPFGRGAPLQDASDMAVGTLGQAFALGVQLSAPVLVFSLVLNVATGLVGRIMPQFQVFFVATPVTVLVGLSIFALSLGLIGLVWIDRFEAYLRPLAEAPVADEDKESKTEEPTQKKLDDARRKGDVVKSMDVPQWASLAGAFGVLAICGGWMSQRLLEAMRPLIARPEAVEISGDAMREVMIRALLAAAPILLAVMLTAGLAGAAGSLLQTGLLFSPSKIAPDLKKLSPMQGLKRLFGPDALVNFGQSFAKLLAVSAVVWMVFKPHARELEQLVALDPVALLAFSRDLLVAMFMGVLIFLGLGAGGDYLWQRHRFMQRQRMSKEELKEDYKQTEGDPHVKAKLKQIRGERSRKRMMQNVAKATVIVTNPTHYAVALRYEPGETAVPTCVAKGVDSLALKIRELAATHDIPIVEDVPLARALYATMEVDETIPRQHFEAVAKIIGFVMGGRGSGGSGHSSPRPQHS